MRQTSFFKESVIMTLHRVDQRNPERIPENQNMLIEVDELESFIINSKLSGWTFISIDELYDNLIKKNKINKTIVLTFDDGYYDNFSNAFPLLNSLDTPFTIYITSNFITKKNYPWWYALEEALLQDTLKLPFGDIKASNINESSKVFNFIRERLLSNADDYSNFLSWAKLNNISCRYEKKLFMSWDNIKELSKSKLVTIGSHTLSHPVLGKIPAENIDIELNQSKKDIELEISKPVLHFAYPYGGKEDISSEVIYASQRAGYKTAVTTNFNSIENCSNGDIYRLPRIFFSPNTKMKSIQKDILLVKFKNLIKRNILNIS